VTRWQAISFPAWRGAAFISPIEVLLSVGRWISGVEWRVAEAEFATGFRASKELNTMGAYLRPISTLELVDLLADGVQMISGELVATRSGSVEPFLIIRSVRGDDWDVEAADRRLLSDVRAVFDNAVEIDLGTS
jgi:hypothetical protein